MAGSDFRAHSRNAADNPNVHENLWVGEVTKAPATVADFVTVRSLHGAGSDELALGDAPWPQPAGKALPELGDECLVAIDNQRNPWIVAWLAPGYPRAPALVNALPSTPYNGQEVYYQSTAMGEKGVAWHLRYRSSSGSAYKWEYVGGAAMYAAIATEFELETEVFQTGKGPAITLPLAGDYEMSLTAQLVTTANECLPIAVIKLGAAAGAETEGILFNSAAGGTANQVQTRTMTRTGLAASTVLEMAYRRVNAGKGKFLRREMWTRPVRVG